MIEGKFLHLIQVYSAKHADNGPLAVLVAILAGALWQLLYKDCVVIMYSSALLINNSDYCCCSSE